ncbi:hypothetical protein PHLH6_31150 [Pseudomonas sp. Seg1]|uniref:hypothetical protein n=1 Tax=Pseudomonas sp. Seg1 TaxID=2678259 RepID=UPI001BB38550|nr:hypothetical protein [Pseudomonas sp. Seg1]BBP71111.1 hypothetical protein PHLH6_31150 [Pseudomonas sp. Seg1]
MTDFGLSVANDYGSVIISSDYKIMVFSERGTFKITSKYTDVEGNGSVMFNKPIRTQEPPQIFVRLVSGVHNDLSIYTGLFGGPGNWTGFLVVSAVRGNPNLQNYTLEYVSCMYSNLKSTSDYGLELFDYQGNTIYTSSDNVVKFSKFSKNWKLTQGDWVDYYDSGLTIDADDFVSISSIDRGVNWFTGHAQYAGLTLLSDGVRMLRINNNVARGDWYYQGTNNTCLAIPVCKFPASRYLNT